MLTIFFEQECQMKSFEEIYIMIKAILNFCFTNQLCIIFELIVLDICAITNLEIYLQHCG